MKVKSLSCVQLFATPWTAAHQAPLSTGFSRQEYWSGSPVPSSVTVSVAAAAKLRQSCPTLCDPIDGSPPGSPVPGILQARTLEWFAISFSNAGKVKSESEVTQSCPTRSDPMNYTLPGSSVHGIFQARVLEWGASAFSTYSFLSFGKIIIVTDTYIMLPLCQALS